MKNHFSILLLFIIFSCSEKIPNDLDGEWVIDEIKYLNDNVYPETISSDIFISFDVEGYENAEKIKFVNEHSAVVLPGFKTDRIAVDYVRNENLIEFKVHEGLNYTDKSYDLTKKIFLHKYEILAGEEKGQLILKSDSTLIKILNQDVLFSKRTNKLLNGF